MVGGAAHHAAALEVYIPDMHLTLSASSKQAHLEKQKHRRTNPKKHPIEPYAAKAWPARQSPVSNARQSTDTPAVGKDAKACDVEVLHSVTCPSG
eukprot:2280493-Amphidinium_carterae.1